MPPLVSNLIRMKTVIGVILFFLATSYGKNIHFKNNLANPVWVGALGNADKPVPNGGGFKVGAGQETTITVGDSWAGRFWARTGCNFDANGSGHCVTGDCGDKLKCNGAGGVPPVSLAEFTMNGYGGVDYYDVSYVDGFNVPTQIAPMNKNVDPNNKYSCGKAGCAKNLNPDCPDKLRQKNAAGNTVACKSACLALNTDQYCCRGAYGTPDKCKSNTWPVNYAKYFKDGCPAAYSYAYDDTSSTYTCNDTGYRIIFG